MHYEIFRILVLSSLFILVFAYKLVIPNMEVVNTIARF